MVEPVVAPDVDQGLVLIDVVQIMMSMQILLLT